MLSLNALPTLDSDNLLGNIPEIALKILLILPRIRIPFSDRIFRAHLQFIRYQLNELNRTAGGLSSIRRYLSLSHTHPSITNHNPSIQRNKPDTQSVITVVIWVLISWKIAKFIKEYIEHITETPSVINLVLMTRPVKTCSKSRSVRKGGSRGDKGGLKPPPSSWFTPFAPIWFRILAPPSLTGVQNFAKPPPPPLNVWLDPPVVRKCFLLVTIQ